MSTSDLSLYVGADFVSAFAMSAFVALTEKGLPFDMRMLDLTAGEQRHPDYAALSLSCRVPTLKHGAFALSESSAIAEYLEDSYPAPAHPPLYPTAAHLRARARQLQAWLRSDFMPLRSERPADLFHAPAIVPSLSPAAAAAAARLIRAADMLIDDEGGCLFGAWSIADVDLAVMLNRLVANADPVPEKISRYVLNQWARASVVKWMQLPRH